MYRYEVIKLSSLRNAVAAVVPFLCCLSLTFNLLVLTVLAGYCICSCFICIMLAFGGLTLLVGWQEGHLAFQKTDWWGIGMVIYLGRDQCRLAYGPADATVSYFSKFQTGFTFLVPAHAGIPGERAIIQVCCLYQ